MDKLKYIFALAGGAVIAYFEKYAVLYVFVCAAIVLDFITGMLAAVIDGTGLSSKIARRGFFKKILLLVAVAFGTFLDVLMPFAAEKVGIGYDGTLIFSSIIGVYICVTESISVAENIVRSTGGTVPKWIIKLLKQAKDGVEKGEDDNGSGQAE